LKGAHSFIKGVRGDLLKQEEHVIPDLIGDPENKRLDSRFHGNDIILN
jgi:hypothetical protein